MPQLSQRKKDKIYEQILHYLFTISPESRFTVSIAHEIARDEEFTLSLLKEIEKKKLVVCIQKNQIGKNYIKRRRWRISNEAHTAYLKHQSRNHNNIYNSQSSE